MSHIILIKPFFFITYLLPLQGIMRKKPNHTWYIQIYNWLTSFKLLKIETGINIANLCILDEQIYNIITTITLPDIGPKTEKLQGKCI